MEKCTHCDDNEDDRNAWMTWRHRYQCRQYNDGDGNDQNDTDDTNNDDSSETNDDDNCHNDGIVVDGDTVPFHGHSPLQVKPLSPADMGRPATKIQIWPELLRMS